MKDDALRDAPPAPPAIPDAYLALIRSDRVSPHLREALLARAEPGDLEAPRSLTPVALAVLRAALDRIIPQAPGSAIDLAARIDAMMADATGNGWRYEALPGDPDAYRAGLATLDDLARERLGHGFAALPGEGRDALLQAVEAGKAGLAARAGRFDAQQMMLWFEELRSDAVRHYVAHPATLARLGYSGIGNGGHGGGAFTGFSEVGMDEREDWEPAPALGGRP